MPLVAFNYLSAHEELLGQSFYGTREQRGRVLGLRARHFLVLGHDKLGISLTTRILSSGRSREQRDVAFIGGKVGRLDTEF